MFLKILCFLFILQSSAYALEIPSNLNESDRISVSQIIGQGASPKYLTNPFPLGGYSGFEIGWSVNNISTDQISLLGDQTTTTSSFQYSQINFSKGIYNNVDVGINFSLPFRQDSVFEFGGTIKWSFFEANFLPINIALILSGNSVNVDDKYISNNLATDILAGLSLDYFSFYLGVGKTSSDNVFAGTDGVTNVTDSGVEETFSTSHTHSFVGFTVQLLDYFIALQADKHVYTAYSTKLGLRF